MIQHIESFNYISFDLFDTLMFRTFCNPIDVYRAVELCYKNKYGKPISFIKNRIKAENLARQRKGHIDVNIDDIYKELDECQNDKDRLMCLEKLVEIDNCVPNRVMVDVLLFAKSLNKKILITTDMYLDRPTICSILKKIGCPFDYLYISGEVGYKKNNGTLFKYILDDLKIEPSAICHIGDNPVSDIERPLEYGITAFLRQVPKPMESETYIRCNNSNIVLENLSLFCKYNLGESILTPEKRIGYTVLGPFLYGFCHWVHDVKKHQKLEKLFFVSREGFLIYQVYRLLFPEENDDCKYISLNRNILRLPYLSLCKGENCRNILSVLPNFNTMSITKFLGFFGIQDEESFLSKIDSYGMDDVISKKEILEGKHDRLIVLLLEEKEAEINNQKELLFKYLRNNSFLGKKVGLINNSFNGSGQFLTQALTNETNTEITGIQFANNKLCKKRLNNKFVSFISDLGLSPIYNEMFYKWSYVLEHLLFEKAGTALSLKERDSVVYAECAVYDFERTNEETIGQIQDYCLQFINDYKVNCKFQLKFDGMLIFKEFMGNPLYEDADLIGALYDDDEVDKGSLIDSTIKFERQFLLSRNIPKCIKWVEGYFAIKRVPKIGLLIYKAKLHLSFYFHSLTILRLLFTK